MQNKNDIKKNSNRPNYIFYLHVYVLKLKKKQLRLRQNPIPTDNRTDPVHFIRWIGSQGPSLGRRGTLYIPPSASNLSIIF